MEVTDGEGRPLQVLTVSLQDEYSLYQPAEQSHKLSPEIQRWVREIPQAWAETAGLGETQHRPPVIIHLKPGAAPTQVRQYPIPREA